MEAIILDEKEEVLEIIDLEPKIFETGNMAFSGKGKMPMDGRCCQGHMILVEIAKK